MKCPPAHLLKSICIFFLLLSHNFAVNANQTNPRSQQPKHKKERIGRELKCH